MNETIKSKAFNVGKDTYSFDLRIASNSNKYIVISEKRYIKSGIYRRNHFIFFE